MCRQAAYFPSHASPGPLSSVNGLAIAGLVCAIAGCISGGVLSPVGLVLSLIALGRSPRGVAVAGVIVSLLGMGCLTGVLVAAIAAPILAILGILGVASVVAAGPGLQAASDIDSLSHSVQAYYADRGTLPSNLGELAPTFYAMPTDREALTDPWGKPYLYHAELAGDEFQLISSGPDKALGTADDVSKTVKIEGAERVTPPLESRTRRVF